MLNYLYGSPKPHAVTDAGDKIYSYDQAGNMTGWTHKHNGTRRVIYWNEENRVKQIDDNGRSTYFLYDDAGERVVKRGEHGETLYINRFYSIRNGELGTKHVFAGETRILSKLVKTPQTSDSNTDPQFPGSRGILNALGRGKGNKFGIFKRIDQGELPATLPVEKDQFYYHTDHLGSSNIITDTYGSVYQHLEYFPYGETWIEEGGSYGGNTPGYKFTGKELDPETGLYYYGARYYDPVLSRWISADPILDKYLPTLNEELNKNMSGRGGIFKPVNLSLYSYAHLNPVVFIDPDGRDVLIPVYARMSTYSDISHWRAPKDPYVIYGYKVYDYDTPEAYYAAVKSGTLTEPIGQIELTFEARMTPPKGQINKGSILGAEAKWAEIHDIHQEYGKKTKHVISITDIGRGEEDFYEQTTSSGLLTKIYKILGLKKSDDKVLRFNIRIHKGGPYSSLGCVTSPNPKFKTKESFENELKKQIPSLRDIEKTGEKTYILIPSKMEVN